MTKAAIIIGQSMSAGGDFPRLDGVENDTADVHGFFRLTARYEIVQNVRDQGKAKVLEVIQTVLDDLRPGDHLVLYFAGHGHGVNNQHVWLCHGATKAQLPWFHEAIPVDHLRAMTEGRGLYRSVFSDCCYDDFYTDGVRRGGNQQMPDSAAASLRTIGIEPITRLAGGIAGSFALINACDRGQTAIELTRTRRGLFTASWLEVMSTAADGGTRVATDLDLSNLIANRMRTIGADHGVIEVPRPLYIGSGDPPVLLDGDRDEREPGGRRKDAEFEKLKGRLEDELAGHDWAAADATVSAMLAIRPGDAELVGRQRTIGQELEKARQTAEAEQARADAERAEAAQRHWRDAEFGRLNVRLAGELAGRDFTAAEKTVTQMLALRPDDAEALERRQSIHAELEAARLTAAADRQRQEGEFDPLKTRLMSELAGGDFAAAEKTVSRMLTLRPKDPESLHHLRTIRTELEAARRAAAAEAARVKAKIERQRRGAEFEALRTKMSDEVARRDFAAAEKTAARLLGLKPKDPDVLDRQRKIRTEIESAHLAAVARAMDQTTREAGPFVQIHQAGWTHADWQRFLERLRVSVPESILSDTEVGKLLDQEAARLRERPGAESARQAAERDAARGREEDGNFDLLRERLTSEVIRKDFATARQTAAAMIRLRPKDREAIHLQKSVERALAADGSPGVRWRKSTEVLPPRFLPAAAIERLAASPKSALALSILAAFETAISAAIITERLGKSSAGDESAAGMSVVTLVLLTAVSIYLAASGRLRHPRVLETVILASAVASLVLLIAMMIAAS